MRTLVPTPFTHHWYAPDTPLNILLVKVTVCFLENVTITFMDKNDPKDPNRWEHCCLLCFRALYYICPLPLVLGLQILDNNLYLESLRQIWDLVMRHSEMVLLANILGSYLLFTSLAQSSILDGWDGSKHASVLSGFKAIYYHLFLYLNHYSVIFNDVNNKLFLWWIAVNCMITLSRKRQKSKRWEWLCFV